MAITGETYQRIGRAAAGARRRSAAVLRAPVRHVHGPAEKLKPHRLWLRVHRSVRVGVFRRRLAAAGA